ncbi:hypothetical protein GHT09_006828 [Marmota monax]|uniref:Uncharacterized protein n=1 Tax=Marmota monax TaxID=9995 RepID=A0A834QP34_MARMO|nr:hypothetical protein GHT09_006828 [Marmota monax]
MTTGPYSVPVATSPGPCRRLYPGEDRASRWTWSPSCPLHVMGHDSAPRLPHCLEVASPRLPLPAHEPGAESALSQRPCVSPQARQAAGRRPVVSPLLPPFACGCCSAIW